VALSDDLLARHTWNTWLRDRVRWTAIGAASVGALLILAGAARHLGDLERDGADALTVGPVVASPLHVVPPLRADAEGGAPAMQFDAAARDNLPPPPIPAADRDCLAMAVFYEARGETIEGQIAVAQVIMNRVKQRKWGAGICAVVYHGEDRGEKCQFSFACHDHAEPRPGDSLWQEARWIADDVAAGRAYLSELSTATHYHATTVAPVWRLGLGEIRRIGNHIFYGPRDPNAPAVVASAGEAAGGEEAAPAPVAREPAPVVREPAHAAPPRPLRHEPRQAKRSSERHIRTVHLEKAETAPAPRAKRLQRLN
jgi:Cell Wall Hydrolase